MVKTLKFMKTLITQLPKGNQGRSIHSPRTKVLLKYESMRREYNRRNKSKLDLITFLCVHFAEDEDKRIQDVNPLLCLAVEILYFDRKKDYLNKAIYNNNFKVV